MKIMTAISGTITALAIAVLVWANQTSYDTRMGNISNSAFASATGTSYERKDWSVYANIADLAQIIAIGGGIAFLVFGIAALVQHSARQDRETRQPTKVPW